MIDHISLRVRDLEKVVPFYKAALAPLGYEVVMEFPDTVGFAAGGKLDFWLTRTDKPLNPTHIAFSGDRSTVHAFHTAAIAAGGEDHGAPGLRAEYHPNYYGAFVLDPEGNNIEAVCHEPESAAKKPKSAPRKKPASRVKADVKGKTAAKAQTASRAKAKTAAKPKAKPKSASKPKAKPAAQKAKPAPKSKAKPAPKAKAKPAPRAKAKPAPKPKAKPVSKAKRKAKR